jgi:hypothetical protein
VSDNAAGGKHRHVRETQSRVHLVKRLFLNFAVAALVMAPLCAHAGDRPVSNITPKVADLTRGVTRDVIGFFGFGGNQANNPTDPQPVAETTTEHPASEVPKAQITAREFPSLPVAIDDAAPPRLPAAVATAPSVETPLRRLFCVEYARMRSGLSVFGDARHWWERAKNLYARLPHPVEEAVMVFSGSKRLKRGHVAVVTDIINPRQIIVDQANWQNKGEIDHATPVLDVSAANDWSQVRVWDMRSNGFGAHVYAISGFIAKGMTTASRD